MRMLAILSLAGVALTGCVVVPVDPGPPGVYVAPEVRFDYYSGGYYRGPRRHNHW